MSITITNIDVNSKPSSPLAISQNCEGFSIYLHSEYCSECLLLVKRNPRNKLIWTKTRPFQATTIVNIPQIILACQNF
jgi:hypothetical protein